MAKRRIYLHIGLPGAGGAFLPAALAHHASALAAAGVHVPTRAGDEVLRAAVELRRDHKQHGYRRREVEGTWAALCHRARKACAKGESVVLGEEHLAGADTDQIALLLDALSGWEVHVVAVVADPASQLVGAWADTIRAGATRSLRRWTRRVLDPAREAPESVAFWAEHDLEGVLHRWSAALRRPDRMHVVVAPRADDASAPVSRRDRAASVWADLGRVVGFDAAALPLTEVDTDPGARLDATGLAVLRGVNRAVDGRVAPGAQRRVVSDHLARREEEASGPELPTLPAELHGELRDLAERWAKAVADAGWLLYGDAADLVPALPTRAVDPDEVGPGARLASVTDSVADLLVEVARLREENDALARRTAKLERKRTKLKTRLAAATAAGQAGSAGSAGSADGG